jgi:hypothetical protein
MFVGCGASCALSSGADGSAGYVPVEPLVNDVPALDWTQARHYSPGRVECPPHSTLRLANGQPPNWVGSGGSVNRPLKLPGGERSSRRLVPSGTSD